MPDYKARADQLGPYLILVAYLPWPEWDKNDRLAPNCIAREAAGEGGRLYFKERESLWKLSASARAYRETVRVIVQPNLPNLPFFAKKPWEATLTQVRAGAAADIDHHAGLIDDMCRAGLAPDDRRLCRLTLDRDDIKGEDGGLYWYSRQLQV